MSQIPPLTSRVCHTPPLVLRWGDLPSATGLSRSTLHRLRKAGVFPAPDSQVGRIPLWQVSTIQDFLSRGA
jgi:predicted DNA-binding transcriptional regulator AlpA